jgi:integration host factor subunit beta
MNRSDIVIKLSELYPKLSRKEIETLVRDLFDVMGENIIKGERIEIRGFGCFSLKERSAGMVRNPREGTSVESEARNVVYFRAGKELRERVDLPQK